MKLLAAPMIAKTHIQNTAPGPPVTMAVATPAILPTPMRAPMLRQNASKEDTLEDFFPAPVSDNANAEVSRIRRICSPFSLIVKMMPSPTMNTKEMHQK